MNCASILSLSFLVLCLDVLAGNASFAQQENANLASEGQAKGNAPVILLTGFEPFGERRSPNPSWEGIKSLDGKQWQGYRLVCKQMPVVWGEPLTLLQGWIREYQPELIISLGQGRADSFALESKASVRRGNGSDNEQQKSSKISIVEDGPDVFYASTDSEKLQQLLAEKGYPIRVSTRAGQYLCEETLYCLEYLKWKEAHSTEVLFCHVPPLGARINDKDIDVEYLRRFTLDMLDACYTLYQMQNIPSQREGTASKKNKHPQEQEIEQFILGYFDSWSKQQFLRYDACFMRNACIQYLGNKGQMATYARKNFIAQQRKLAETSPVKRTETAESVKISFEAEVVRVVVYWKLTEDKKDTYGYDHFTLVRKDGVWKIANLLFYSVPTHN